MLTPKYARLALRFLRRRLLTVAGRRWHTDGMLFLGPGLQLQIGRGAEIRFGRFVWIGHGTKIRCHEGRVEIGAKTVLGQECTISAYQRVRIGEQCVIADRAMFIDFDHGVVDVERPIRQQGIYMEPVRVGSNCPGGSPASPRARCAAPTAIWHSRHITFKPLRIAFFCSFSRGPKSSIFP